MAAGSGVASPENPTKCRNHDCDDDPGNGFCPPQNVVLLCLVAFWDCSATHSSISPRVIPKPGPNPGPADWGPGPPYAGFNLTFSIPSRSNLARSSSENA